MKRLIPLLLALAFVFMTVSCGKPLPASGGDLITIPRASEGELKTPEAALQCFLEGLKKNDLYAVMKAFPVYEMPAHLDYKAYADRLKITFTPVGPMPEKYTELNTAYLIAQAGSSFKTAVIALAGYEYGVTVVQKTADDTQKFVDAVSPDKLAGITMAAEDFSKANGSNASYLKHMEESAKVYGADECRTYTVALELNGNRALCETVTMLRYGKNWYMMGASFMKP